MRRPVQAMISEYESSTFSMLSLLPFDGSNTLKQSACHPRRPQTTSEPPGCQPRRRFSEIFLSRTEGNRLNLCDWNGHSRAPFALFGLLSLL